MESCEICKVYEVSSGGSRQKREVLVLTEQTVKVFINDVLKLKIVCTPLDQEDMIVGRLLTEGYIQRAEQISSLDFQKETGMASVRILSGAGGLAPDRSPFLWKKEWIFHMAQCFREDTFLHRTTAGTHSCLLAHNGEIRYCCEDIGRHNALDKAAGYALRAGIPLEETLVYTSGRVPADMVKKAVCARIPVLISRSVPTIQAAALARKHGVTLIGRAEPEHFLLYTT